MSELLDFLVEELPALLAVAALVALIVYVRRNGR